MAITRTPILDDDGTGTTGTVLDNAWKQELYNQIDGLVINSPLNPCTPVWTNAGASQPAIGNGQMAGRWMQIGKLVVWDFTIFTGSTTVFGTGGFFTFGLPLGVPPYTPPLAARQNCWAGFTTLSSAGGGSSAFTTYGVPTNFYAINTAGGLVTPVAPYTDPGIAFFAQGFYFTT